MLFFRQLIFLQMLLGFLEDRSNADRVVSVISLCRGSGRGRGRGRETKTTAASSKQEGDLVKLLHVLVSSLRSLDPSVTASVASSSSEKNVMGAKDDDSFFEKLLAEDAVPLVLHVLGSALALVPRSAPESDMTGRGSEGEGEGEGEDHGYGCLRTSLSQSGELVDCCLGYLRVASARPLEQHRDAKRDMHNPMEPRKSETVRAALTALGNLVYACPAAQDLFRDRGGLIAVLPHCGTDFSNPLAREWALLCIRNACEGNAASQAFVESLQPQSTEIRDERMAAAGLRVELNPSSGTFKIIQEKPEASSSSSPPSTIPKPIVNES